MKHIHAIIGGLIIMVAVIREAKTESAGKDAGGFGQ